jgi:hypothetical protein
MVFPLTAHRSPLTLFLHKGLHVLPDRVSLEMNPIAGPALTQSGVL